MVLITAQLGVARPDWGQRKVRKITPGTHFHLGKLGWRHVLPMSFDSSEPVGIMTTVILSVCVAAETIISSVHPWISSECDHTAGLSVPLPCGRLFHAPSKTPIRNLVLTHEALCAVEQTSHVGSIIKIYANEQSNLETLIHTHYLHNPQQRNKFNVGSPIWAVEKIERYLRIPHKSLIYNKHHCP